MLPVLQSAKNHGLQGASPLPAGGEKLTFESPSQASRGVLAFSSGLRQP